MSLFSRIPHLARRISNRPLLTLSLAVGLTILSALAVGKLRFDSDLTNLLPADHPDLVLLRKIQARFPTDTGFMVLLSKSQHFAVDDAGRAMVHDGAAWHRTATESPLYAVWGFAIDEVFAAGAGGKVLRYDGARWSPVETGTSADLHGLWGRSRSELYAVGAGGAALRYDGTRWRVMQSGARQDLLAVSGDARGRAYAVGAAGTILRLEGEGWVSEPAPVKSTLRGVWAYRDGRAFAVGDGGVMLVREEGRWRQLESGTRRTLNAVWGTSSTYVLAVGAEGTVLRYNGEAVEPMDSRTEADLLAVHGLSWDKVWAAGADCEHIRRSHHRSWWWHGPFDTKDPVGTWPPPLFRPRPERCTSRYTGIWRPEVELQAIADFLPRLAERVAESPLVGRVLYKKPVSFFTDRALYFLAVEDLQKLVDSVADTLERETAKATGLFVDLDEQESKEQRNEVADSMARYQRQAASLTRSELYKPYDEAAVGLLVYPQPNKSGLNDLRRLRGELERIIAGVETERVDPHLRIDIAGDGMVKIREYDNTIADITGLGWLAVGGLTLLLGLYFRRAVGLLFIVIPLCMSITWTFALVAFTIGTLNTVTGFLFAVLFGLGIDYGLQIYGRYKEDRLSGVDIERAMDHALLDTGRATVTSACTSSAALLTLLITDFRGFSEFGFIAGVGIILALCSFMCVMPAMIRVAERLGLLKLDELARRRAAAAHPPRRLRPVRLPRLVLVISGLGAAFGAFGLARVQVEYDHRVLRPINRPNEILDSGKQAFGESFTPTLLMAPSRAELRAALDAIARGRERLGSRSTVRRTSSILDLVPPRQPEKHTLLEELDRLLSSKRWNMVSDAAKKTISYDRLRRMASAEPFELGDLPETLRRSFHGPGFGDTWLAMVYYNVQISDTREARRFKAQVGRFEGSKLLSLSRLLPADAQVWIEEQRVEVACPAASVARCQRALREAQHDGAPAFARVMTASEAVEQELAVEGGLRGSIVAWARRGLVPVARQLDAAVVPSGTFRVSSSELVLTEVIEVMLRDGRLAFVIALLVVFLACLVDFRSWAMAALACLPLGFGLLWTFGTLHLLGLKLNMFNFVVLPALLGIGIDYGVHLVHRHREEGIGSIPRVRGALYWVLVTCACTSIIGFGNMSLASHTGLRSLGVLAIIGLISILLAATYTLPALLDALDRRRRRREALERSFDDR